ncbi:MAG: hypothetical protein VX632_08115, partial [Chloroflexota bacterium]|nr:hypothetical protein [Chloroflexota bacterium]
PHRFHRSATTGADRVSYLRLPFQYQGREPGGCSGFCRQKSCGPTTNHEHVYVFTESLGVILAH